jgi:hypothetical protein
MIIKANGCELEITDNFDIYIGVPKKGQIFKKRDELNDNVIKELSVIQGKAENLIKHTEQFISK